MSKGASVKARRREALSRKALSDKEKALIHDLTVYDVVPASPGKTGRSRSFRRDNPPIKRSQSGTRWLYDVPALKNHEVAYKYEPLVVT